MYQRINSAKNKPILLDNLTRNEAILSNNLGKNKASLLYNPTRNKVTRKIYQIVIELFIEPIEEIN